MKELAIACVAFVACASPVAVDRPTPPATHDATVAGDASVAGPGLPTVPNVTVGLIDAGSVEHVFTAPPAKSSPGPATSSTQRCLDASAVAYENAREVAALDAAMRANGGMLLEGRIARTSDHPIGAMFRGANGEQLLVVGQAMECTAQVPLIAIAKDLSVFEVMPVAKPAASRKIVACAMACGGCGIATPMVSIVVEVPDHAHLVERRYVSYPLDVKVDVGPVVDARGRPAMCPPVPAALH